MSGRGISWTTCKSAPRSRQIITPAPHHSAFYRHDALPATQPTVSKHWRQDIELITQPACAPVENAKRCHILSTAAHRWSWWVGCSDCTRLMTLPLNGWRNMAYKCTQQQQLVWNQPQPTKWPSPNLMKINGLFQSLLTCLYALCKILFQYSQVLFELWRMNAAATVGFLSLQNCAS